MEAEKNILKGKETGEEGEDANKRAEEEFNKLNSNPLFKENMDEFFCMIGELDKDNEERKEIVKGMDLLLKGTLIKKTQEMGI